MERIALFLEHKEHRALLKEWLGARFQVVTKGTPDESVAGFDLGIVDGTALKRYIRNIGNLKETAQPVFLPFLLVIPRSDLESIACHLRHTVDDLIFAPIERNELMTRVDALLHTRKISFEFHGRPGRLFDDVPLGLYRCSPEGRILEANMTTARLLGYSHPRFLVKIRPADLFVEPEDRRFWQAAIKKGESVHRFQMRLRRRDGAVIWVEENSRAVCDNKGHLLYYEGSMQEITDQKRTEEELRQRSLELSALNLLGTEVSSCLSLDKVIEAALHGILAAASPDLALVFLKKQDVLTLKGMGPKGSPFLLEEIPIHHVGECLCGLALEEEKPVYSRNIHKDPRCTLDECKNAGLCSFASLPLRAGTEVVGILGVACGTERDFESQAEFLETLADGVAVGIRNALLYEQVRAQADELEQRVKERTRDLRRMVDLMADREVRMKELKGIIARLRAQIREAGMEPVADDRLRI
ncbi:MAG: PAS domain S-box protein [Deltaproteobacteria bacterium]|nr:PAS domain S-box protein [Deltaproteobacteria bacterium]